MGWKTLSGLDKAGELRVRNIIWDGVYYYYIVEIGNTPEVQVIEIDHIGIRSCENCFLDWEDIKWIPLSEEWLLRFGFEMVENGYYGSMPYNKPCWLKFSFTILIWDDGTFVYDWNGGNTILKYVHQLQNLYFALTEEELIIKNNDTE